ncbi:MAG: dTDP-4-dehydrorhamnose 3,5-epimerase, partial [Thiotrichaceae bacterium]|nr:dTDP-4-dehydrorhamnose 3,5-epimerase [Thiotrichaceae bacterium]
MKFIETILKDAYLIEPELHHDERGFFARTWCQKAFTQWELNPNLVQCNISFNKKQGTLRGLHYQTAPHEEVKLIRCTTGSVYDVIVDIRPNSPTFKHWFGVELSADNRTMLYVPAGFAHGFQTLMDNVEVFYQMSSFYEPASACGIRWDSPLFNIQWPL